jgi:DNA polymerase I-like protein with 3'-5' exonuclease and polymerase domains
LKYLQKKLEATLEKRDYLFGIDGRVLQIRAKYSALNTLLQSAGAIVMKKATTLLWDMLTAKGYVFGREVAQVAHVHDEFQLVVRHGLEEEVGRCAVEAIRKAGEYFGFRCPLDGEYKVGTNWAETH